MSKSQPLTLQSQAQRPPLAMQIGGAAPQLTAPADRPCNSMRLPLLLGWPSWCRRRPFWCKRRPSLCRRLPSWSIFGCRGQATKSSASEPGAALGSSSQVVLLHDSVEDPQDRLPKACNFRDGLQDLLVQRARVRCHLRRSPAIGLHHQPHKRWSSLGPQSVLT